MLRFRMKIDLDENRNVIGLHVAQFNRRGEKESELVRPWGPFDPMADELALLVECLVTGRQLKLF